MSLFFLTGLLLVPAVRNWQAGWGPSRTVGRFVDALRTGNREALLPLVSPARVRSLPTDPRDWEPSQHLHCRIDRVQVDGNVATVDATLTEFGVSVRPKFSLERTPDGRWLVVEIVGISPE